jgi:hypothetical protein
LDAAKNEQTAAYIEHMQSSSKIDENMKCDESVKVSEINHVIQQSCVQPVDDPWLEAIRKMDAEDTLRKKVGLLIQGRYEVLAKIAFGSYGSIFVARDQHNTLAKYDVRCGAQ